MIGDVSGMGVLVCSNELTKGAGNVGYRNKVVVLVVLVFDVFALSGKLSAHRPVLGAPPMQKPCSGLSTTILRSGIPRTAQSSLIPITRS